MTWETYYVIIQEMWWHHLTRWPWWSRSGGCRAGTWFTWWGWHYFRFYCCFCLWLWSIWALCGSVLHWAQFWGRCCLIITFAAILRAENTFCLQLLLCIGLRLLLVRCCWGLWCCIFVCCRWFLIGSTTRITGTFYRTLFWSSSTITFWSLLCLFCDRCYCGRCFRFCWRLSFSVWFHLRFFRLWWINWIWFWWSWFIRQLCFIFTFGCICFIWGVGCIALCFSSNSFLFW